MAAAICQIACFRWNTSVLPIVSAARVAIYARLRRDVEPGRHFDAAKAAQAPDARTSGPATRAQEGQHNTCKTLEA